MLAYCFHLSYLEALSNDASLVSEYRLKNKDVGDFYLCKNPLLGILEGLKPKTVSHFVNELKDTVLSLGGIEVNNSSWESALSLHERYEYLIFMPFAKKVFGQKLFVH